MDDKDDGFLQYTIYGIPVALAVWIPAVSHRERISSFLASVAEMLDGLLWIASFAALSIAYAGVFAASVWLSVKMGSLRAWFLESDWGQWTLAMVFVAALLLSSAPPIGSEMGIIAWYPLLWIIFTALGYFVMRLLFWTDSWRDVDVRKWFELDMLLKVPVLIATGVVVVVVVARLRGRE